MNDITENHLAETSGSDTHSVSMRKINLHSEFIEP